VSKVARDFGHRIRCEAGSVSREYSKQEKGKQEKKSKKAKSVLCDIYYLNFISLISYFAHNSHLVLEFPFELTREKEAKRTFAMRHRANRQV
jgi:hypothetical protein